VVTQESPRSDGLFGLLDAAGARRALEHELKKARSTGKKVGVVHAAVHIPRLHEGDQQQEMEAQVLGLLSFRLTSSVRFSDPSARVGARDLLVVLPGLGTADDACSVAEGVVRSLRHPLSIDNRVLQVGINAGIAVSGDHGYNVDRLLELARIAALEARKRPGRGCAMAEKKLTSRVVVGLTRKRTIRGRDASKRDGDPKAWTGPRTER
jgi:GGDEF domain-containing protein